LPPPDGKKCHWKSRSLVDLPDFAELWQRRTVFGDDEGNDFHLLSVPDLVQAKKPNAARIGR